MSPTAIIALAQWLAPFIMEKGPKFIEDIVAIFRAQNPTPADWDALKAKYAQPEPPQS